MRSLRSVLALATLVAIATALVGWWAVPVVSALWALVTARTTWRTRPLLAGAAAVAAWLGILAYDAAVGDLPATLRTFAGAMQLPSMVLVLVTAVFALALAWSASGVIVPLMRRRRPAVGHLA